MSLYVHPSVARLTPAEIEVKRLQRAAAFNAGRAQHANRYEQQAAARFGIPGTLSADTDMEALHHAALRYQAAYPGTDYLTAVKAAQTLG